MHAGKLNVFIPQFVIIIIVVVVVINKNSERAYYNKNVSAT